jgi:hypothetical protein
MDKIPSPAYSHIVAREPRLRVSHKPLECSAHTGIVLHPLQVRTLSPREDPCYAGARTQLF